MLPSQAVECRRILVVDDNPDAADSLSMLLQLDGHSVRVAGDGDSALSALADLLPDVAILDIGLPGSNGFEVAKQIRSRYGETLRLIALTGWGEAEDRMRSTDAGFDAHLTKPVDYQALQSLIS